MDSLILFLTLSRVCLSCLVSQQAQRHPTIGKSSTLSNSSSTQTDHQAAEHC